MENKQMYTKAQLTWLVVLRVFIGWHFAYEGWVKLLNPRWTSLPYLLDSQGAASSFFIKLTQNPALMDTVNFLNQWSLLLIGFALIIGCFSRIASIGGILLLLLYTLSHPSFIGASYLMPFEGSYLWIDKNLVECAALAVLCTFPTSHVIGLDRYMKKIMPAWVRKYKLI
ncbi:thiosulfate dehydrogenase [quinone] large subunit [Parabacteroides sp. PF5-5]|uniref:DoxX family membrane protein n=1 Tax=unclassified Parabacteroides TaxID=2649774 RepID=UPI0024769C04|nr:MULTISPECIES: DoxX family membrane protein [unclassified Parabacteroides]MDH6307025.1 thiosulfate dehydrogenase [quinone] large subunit [Parabacteroides sp. PH5-39]MDH6317940.1 thiosulfate dehydrogenase [quinone] large subunit [Parabacteroides sp. PF5-13]MDH6321656.1 thiosulfate dehydrogenase [quinone] large subunit [Parabacteroides sp. PH5-13]MDH6325407.1 thiosulfate dehydrogenase [quinone] large subunit [Parabacteroides sp. PH5-8]MDH6329128.1 thiosulfate dehydrogenase [quinone] large subu